MSLVADAARALSLEETEIRDALDAPAGLVVTTADGVTYIVVPEDAPDADGKTGLMFLAAPTENYAGGFPIYAMPADHADDVASAIEAAPDPEVGAAVAALLQGGEPAKPRRRRGA